jgi:hypothetical protein
MFYNEYIINKAVDAEIKKYARYYKKNGSNLDKLATIQINTESRFIDNIKEKNLPYIRECEEMKNILVLVENRFDYYFQVGTMYAWINGNKNFKNLLKTL